MATSTRIHGEVKDTLFTSLFMAAEPSEAAPQATAPGCADCGTSTLSRCHDCDRNTCGNCLDTPRHVNQWHRDAA